MTMYRRGVTSMVTPRTDPQPWEILPQPPAWMRDAACQDSDPEQWFPHSGENAGWVKSVCLGPPLPGGGRDESKACPVRVQCLEYALAFTGDARIHGVWGGLTEKERAKLRKGAA